MNISFTPARLLLGFVLSGVILAALSSAFSETTEMQEDRDDESVSNWIRQSAIAIENPQRDYGDLENRFRQAKVVALGEATHGQHEVFECKRQITMDLIRKHGFRVVAYEASVSKLTEANAYINGTSDDRSSAMGGFGMLIWQIEENGKLLDELRTWNQKNEKRDHVRLIGCDAQDSQAAWNSLRQFPGLIRQELHQRALDLQAQSNSVLQQLFAGNRPAWDKYAAEIDDLGKQLKAIAPTDKTTADRYTINVEEFLASLSIYSSKGARDRVLAELLLMQLEKMPSDTRCVIWAHNGHVQRSSLRYLGSEELAMGGHLGKTLGNKYYAIGVAFGEGEFQANVQRADSRWGFRRYQLSPPPKGSLEAMLATAGHEKFLLDLRSAPASQAVQQWLNTGHGQRWYGGYGVPEDYDTKSSDVSNLLPTIPAEDFDGLLYISKTTAAEPLDHKLLAP